MVVKKKLSDILEKARTGDALLFSGRGKISKVIKCMTASKWSHIGMVVVTKDGRKYVWHSAGGFDHSITSVLDDEIFTGVQLNRMSDLIKTYDGDVALRPLRDSNGEPMIDFNSNNKEVLERSEKLYYRLTRWIFKENGKPYEQNYHELCCSAIDVSCYPSNIEDTSSYFCSELYAKTLMVLGIINDPGRTLDMQKNYKHPPSNEYTPADFSEDGRVSFKNGWNLGKIIYIDIGHRMTLSEIRPLTIDELLISYNKAL